MLTITRCTACGATMFPPRDQCPQCSDPAPESVAVDGNGRLVAATWVPSRFGLDGFGADGYGVAWVDLDAGPRVQVLVESTAPEPGTRGMVRVEPLEGVELPVFDVAAP